MPRKLSIGFVIDDNLDSVAGVQQFTTTLGVELASRGHNVKYLTSQTSKENPLTKDIYSLAKKITVRMNGNRVGTPLLARLAEIKDALRENEFDVIHVTTPYSPFLAGRIIKRSGSAAVVGTFHIAVDTLVAGVGAWVLAKVQWLTLRRFDYWTAVSAAAEDFAETRYGIKVESITSNPIDLSRFAAPDILEIHKSNKFKIIFLGRLVERKGVQHLLAAIAKLNDYDRSSLEVVIGGGGPLKSELMKFVSDNDLGEIVDFAGYIPEDQKASFLASADIAAFPSTGGECFGISLLEGMAVGSTVVLGGDNKGYRTVLGESPGLLIDATDHSIFAGRISEIMNSESERQSIVEWQDVAVRNYDVPIIADQMLKIYETAISRRTQHG